MLCLRQRVDSLAQEQSRPSMLAQGDQGRDAELVQEPPLHQGQEGQEGQGLTLEVVLPGVAWVVVLAHFEAERVLR